MIKNITLWDEKEGGGGFILQNNYILPKKIIKHKTRRYTLENIKHYNQLEANNQKTIKEKCPECDGEKICHFDYKSCCEDNNSHQKECINPDCEFHAIVGVVASPEGERDCECVNTKPAREYNVTE